MGLLRGPRRLPRGRLYDPPIGQALTVLAPGGLRHGPACASLCARLADHTGARHAALLPHARVALAVLLESLALRPGSRVLMSPVTIPDIVNVVLDAGLVPRWVDLAPSTGQIDPQDLAAKVDRSCRALLVTHLFGLASPMDAVMAIAEAHDLIVLEDASQSMGAALGGRPMGRFGLAGVFSLTTLKPVSSALGGLVITDDAALAGHLRRRARELPPPPRRAFTSRLVRDLALDAATRPWFYDRLGHPLVGLGERASPALVARVQRGDLPGLPGGGLEARRRRLPPWMWSCYTDLQARLASASLDRFDAALTQRRALGEHLLSRLAVAPGRPALTPGSRPAWWRFPYFSERPQALRRALFRAGIDTAMTNLRGAHREAAFASFAAPCPEADVVLDRAVLLPIHPSLTLTDMDRIADAVLEAS